MKIFIFSHIADADGITPIVLSKLVFKDFDYKLLDNPIDEDFLNYINNNDMSKYDYIFMTDLCINKDTVNKLSDEFKSKFIILDHHISNIEMNEYSFINIIDEENNIKESGTSLYYKYLLNIFDNDLLKRESTKRLVELVRLGDTWTFNEQNKEDSLNIASFLGIVGIDEYVDYFYNFILNNEEFYYEDKLKYLFETENKRKDLYIKEKESQVIPCYIEPYNVGVVFAENYRSSLGNELANKFIDKYDFIIIINISRSVSLRGIKEIDLSKFAKIYGGKGHKKAAGFALPISIKEKVIKEIFNEVIIKGE